MPYQYGMQNSPSGGNGLGGLPKKQTTPRQVTYTKILGSTSTVLGVILPPANAKYMRVAAIGAGGAGPSAELGGGGGACAASKIVTATPISYSIAGTSASSGGTIATFQGYVLVGGQGVNGTISVAGVGGIASGGDYNYSGGDANSTAGGGAAGPNGAGQVGNPVAALLLGSSGWGVGGGAGGRAGGGGCGTGAAIVTIASPTLSLGATIWGKTNSTAVGGELGGGGGASSPGGAGGVGGIVVEWFYD